MKVLCLKYNEKTRLRIGETARRRTSVCRGSGNLVSGGHRLAEEAGIWSAEDFGLPRKREIGQRRTSARRGSGKSVSGGFRLTEEAEIWSAEDFGLPWKREIGQRSISARRFAPHPLTTPLFAFPCRPALRRAGCRISATARPARSRCESAATVTSRCRSESESCSASPF